MTNRTPGWPTSLLRATGLLALLATPAFWLRHGFHDFSAPTDLQLAGLVILGVGLLEAGRLLAAGRAGVIGDHPRDASPRMFRLNVALLAVATFTLTALGGFLALLPVVEPWLG